MTSPAEVPAVGGEGSSRAVVWRRALANGDLRRLLGAMVVSQTGDWLYSVALVVFVFDATQSVGWVAASVVVRQVAFISCGAIGGVLADRFNRRRWMIGINLAEAVVLSAMAVVGAVHGPSALMIGLAFVATVLSAGYHPAVFATIPAVVSESDLAAANAVVSTVEQVAFVAGPALGALVVEVSSSAPAFAIDAGSFLVAAWFISGMRDSGHGDDEEVVSMRARLVAGMRAITGSPSAAVVIAMITGALAAFGFEQVLYVAVSADRLGTGSSGVGMMTAAYGAGGVVASLIVGRIAGRERPVPFLAGAFLVSGLALMALAAITAPALAYAVLFVGGGAFLTFEVVSVTVLQRTVAPELMGRVFGILMTVGSTATLLGAIAAPAIANGVNLRTALVVAGAIPLVLLASVSPRLARLDRIAATRGRELAPRLAVLSQLGMFEGAPVPSLERLAAAVSEQPVTAGTVVVREGDEADAFFVARAGTFDVTVVRDGATSKIDELHPDDWFGEIGLVDRAPRNATVTASTEGLVWRIDGDDFLGALEQTPGLNESFGSLMSARIGRARSGRPDSLG